MGVGSPLSQQNNLQEDVLASLIGGAFVVMHIGFSHH